MTRNELTLKCIIGLALIIAFGSALASGQQVYWSPNSGTLQQGKANRLQQIEVIVDKHDALLK